VKNVERVIAVIREAVASAWSQPVASAVTVIMVAGMCATVLLTTGRTVGAEQSVLNSIDSAGTRSIVIRAEPDAGLSSDVLERLAHIGGVEWAGAFSAATDVRNVALEAAPRVPLRKMWSSDIESLGLPHLASIGEARAWVSPAAKGALAMLETAGGLQSTEGELFGVGGDLETPDYLAFLEPLVIVPEAETVDAPAPVSVLVVIAERPDLVTPISEATLSVLAVEDVSKVTLSTSADLANLRGLVQGQLGTFGRGLIVVIFGLTALLVAAILYGLVMLRRRDFGRRRALGASRGLIVALLLSQTAILSATGAIIGSAGAGIALIATADPLPGLNFFAAVAVAGVVVSVIAAALPAIAAARRDPIRELRVP
jgi:putative ABC transport system permease protein